MVYRGSIARRLISLSTLRRGSCPPTTQDSLPAAGPALPDGIGYPQGSRERFQAMSCPPLPSFLAQGQFIFLAEVGGFLGLPLGRGTRLTPSRSAVALTQESEPYGRPDRSEARIG